MARRRDSRKRWQWQRRMERFEQTGQSVAEFCRGEGVSQASFYQWRRRLSETSGPSVGEASAATSGRLAAAVPAAAGLLAWRQSEKEGQRGNGRLGNGRLGNGRRGNGRRKEGVRRVVGTARPTPSSTRASGDSSGGFLPVRLVGSASVAVELPGGARMEIPTSDTAALQVAIEALVQADARRGGGEPC